MEEVNKKKITKSHSYNENFPFTQKDIIFLKPETEESKLNRSILKRQKRASNKKVLFNLNKFKIKNFQNKNTQSKPNANDSLLKTNNTKNQTDLIEGLKKSTENKNLNSNNDITNNNMISMNNKTLYKNKSQESLYTALKPKYNYPDNPPESKKDQEENILDLNLVQELNNAMNPKISGEVNSNILNLNEPYNDIQFNENNLESLDNIENIENNTINAKEPNPFQNTNTISKKASQTLPKLFNSTKRRKRDKIWTFLMKSRKEKTSANDIIIHYLKENERDNSKNIPFNNFKKYLDKNDYKKFNYGLDKIYGNSQTFLRRLEEIKKNNIIAFKKDFNIENYQSTLLKILKKRVSQKSYINLQTSYRLFNERNYGMLIPRGRYINLAEKLKDFLSKDIYEKMKRTDRNYLLYLEKKEEQKHKLEVENENRITFYKKLNKTLRTFDKKMRREKSY